MSEVAADAAGRRPQEGAVDQHRQPGDEAAAQQRAGSATDGDERHGGGDEVGVVDERQTQRPAADGGGEAGEEGDGGGACAHDEIFYHARVRFAVTGVGVVSPIGVGEDAFFAALDDGRSGVANDSDGTLAARVGEFGAKNAIAPASLRRMPRLSQMAIVAGKQALGTTLPYDGARVGVVLGTGLGTLEETIAFMRGYLDGGPEAASPLLFPSSVMNAAAGQLALECKLRGPNSTVNHRDASPLAALTMACDLLTLGRADALLVGGVDELSAPALTGWRKLGALDAGLMPGEGAGMLLVEREEDARMRGARVRALVVGRGETSDDRPRVGWGKAAWPEAARAVREAAAGRRIDLVMSGANGSSYDAREQAAIDEGVGARVPMLRLVPLVGESFSSAALRLVAAVHVLEREPKTIERVLVPSFAQGGANVVVVLERA